MKLGIQLSLWTPRPLATEHGRLLPELKRLGYDTAELHIAEMNDMEATNWVRVANNAGIELVPSLVMRPNVTDPASPDMSVRMAAAEAIGRGVYRAMDFGSNMLVGPMFQAPGCFTGAAPTRQELEWVAEVLHSVDTYELVTLAVEPLNRYENYIANTLDQAAAIIGRYRGRGLALLADTHHANIEEKDVTMAFVRNIDRIGYIHISENHRGIPGEGHAAPPSLFRALRAAGYDGPLTVEAFTTKHPALARRLHLWRPMFDGDELHLAARASEYIRRCWEGDKA